jgi:hypothetical protein
MGTFYAGLKDFQRPSLSDLQTQGGNSYADLKLTIRTFAGQGRIDITPGALVVGLPDMARTAGNAEAAKAHLAWCEDTLGKALEHLEISERLVRASMWTKCEGGSAAVENFLAQKGNAALKLDEGAYASLKKDFTLQFSGLDASRATKVGLILQRSMGEGDLFVQFDYTLIGSPAVAKTVSEQFQEAESELRNLLLHVGLESKREHG